jgi:hypothetical protein
MPTVARYAYGAVASRTAVAVCFWCKECLHIELLMVGSHAN